MTEFRFREVFLQRYFNWNLSCLDLKLKVNTLFRKRNNPVKGDLIRMVQVFEMNSLMMLSNVELETSMMIHIKLVIESSLN